ncbi:hypothetical protein [Nonomuraea sp. NPDC001699]
MSGAAGLAGGVAAAERWLLVAFTVVRTTSAVIVVAMALSGESRHWLMAVALAESAVVTGLSWRAGRLPPGWAVLADGLFLAAMTLAVLTGSARPHEWDNWPFDYAVPYVIGIGLGGGGWRVSLPALAPMLVAVTAAAPMTGNPLPDASFDLATLTVNTMVGVLVARAVRRRGAEVDAARQEAMTAEAAAAIVRERAAHARVIHDQVLQTLELLGHQGRVAGSELRDQVRAEAGRLRTLIGSGGRGTAGDGGMGAVADHARRLGLAAELTSPDGPAVPEEIATAVREYVTRLAAAERVPGKVVIFAEVVDAGPLVTITHPGPPAQEGAHPGVETEVIFTPGEGSDVEFRVARP